MYSIGMTLFLAHYYLDPSYHHFNDTYALNSVDVFVLSITLNILLNLSNFVILLSCCNFLSKKNVVCMMITEYLALFVFGAIIMLLVTTFQVINTLIYIFLTLFYLLGGLLPFLYNMGIFLRTNGNKSYFLIAVFIILLFFLLFFLAGIIIISLTTPQVEQSWEDTINYSYISIVNLLFVALQVPLCFLVFFLSAVLNYTLYANYISQLHQIPLVYNQLQETSISESRSDSDSSVVNCNND